MNFLKGVGLVLLLLSLPAVASVYAMGIHDVSHVWLDQPTRIGSVVLPAGDYANRHSMEGGDDGMAFQNATSKTVFKVNFTLVPLGQKASQDRGIFELRSGSERILHQLVFRGDTAKHVFQRSISSTRSSGFSRASLARQTIRSPSLAARNVPGPEARGPSGDGLSPTCGRPMRRAIGFAPTAIKFRLATLTPCALASAP